MTIHYIPIDGDLKDAFEKTHPGETVEEAVRYWLEKRVSESHTTTVTTVENGKRSLVDTAKSIGEKYKLTPSDDEIRRIRHEGRP